MNWKMVEDWFELEYRGVTIVLEKRPLYCDRGNWYAKLFAVGVFWIDEVDGWPRYYFDLNAAKKECEAFLLKREALGQFEGKAGGK